MKTLENMPIASRTTDPALRQFPSKLFVETTTSCNLGCFMCVKQTGKCGIIEGEMSSATFTSLEPAFHHLAALILNGIGEPLLNPRLDDYIRFARELMPTDGWIGFQSNGLLLNDERARTLLAAGLDKICISVDAVTPEMLRKVREGAEISTIGNALEALVKAKQSTGKAGFKIGIEFVLMRSNISELPELLRWAASRDVSFVIVTHVLPYDKDHAQEAVYETCSNEAITLFRSWQNKASAAAVDLNRYPKIIWNYHKSAEDLRVVNFVEQMKADAERQGIFLDLKKLFNLDPTWLTQVAEVFRIAEKIALDNGLELQLPEQVLKEQRRCEFVEDGSVFVSWKGDIHPCYFLWHAYHCHASGWEQMVQPKTFGNLAEQDILQIWNSNEFKTFRGNVIGYDYPYCSSCSLAPCDYVQTEEFEQDCHINSEPCGSCLWCMGLFQCLR